MILDVKCLVVLFLMVECCYTQEPQEKRCVAGYELSFFYGSFVRKKRSEAVKACEEYGASRLVKVDSQNITDAIDTVIIKDERVFYIDGKPGTGRSWTWSDGTKIYLRGELGGYQNWYDGQPNNVGGNEDCIIVGRRVKKWLDSTCHDKLGYICQKDLDPCITVNSSISDVHKCVATGSTIPQVEWRKNDNAVTTNLHQTTYQTKVSDEAILYSENATIGDAGNYVCAAWVGVNSTKKFSEPVNIKVNGKPSIIDIKSFPCNTSLLILWEPNRTALGFLHRITALPSNGSVLVLPTEQAYQRTEITGLQPKTQYTIQIFACPKNDSCTTVDHTISETATTNGTSSTITDANLVQLNESKACNVSWDWPYSITENTTTQFKLILDPDPTSMPKNEEVLFVNATQGRNLYSFEPLQSSSYQVKVQSVESVELCGEVVAVGSCIGKDAGKRSDMLKIIIPVAVGGGLFLLLIAVLLIFFIKRRKNKGNATGMSNVTVNRSTTNPQVSTDQNAVAFEMNDVQSHKYAAADREVSQNNVYSLATAPGVQTAPHSVPLYAAVNRNQGDQEYSVVANRHSPSDNTYDCLHSQQQNMATQSTDGAVYSAVSKTVGQVNEEYSSISRNDIPSSSTYDTLHGDKYTGASGEQRPETESQPVYSVVNKN